jgi:hypothetical protein
MTSATGRRWAGWIAFAGWLMVIIAAIDFFEGLIAVIRDQYFLFGPNQIIVFDMTKWGWIMMIWGIILGLGGLGLLSGATWARWFTIVVASINILGQLGSFGSAAYPLWALASLALTLVVLYALIVRWGPAQEEIVREGM